MLLGKSTATTTNFSFGARWISSYDRKLAKSVLFCGSARKSYKRAIRALTLQALWRLLHTQLMEFIGDCDSTLKANLGKYSLNEETGDFEHLISALKTDQFLDIREQFLQKMKQNPNLPFGGPILSQSHYYWYLSELSGMVFGICT